MDQYTLWRRLPVWMKKHSVIRKFGFELVFGKVINIPDPDLYFPQLEPWRSLSWRKVLRDGDDHSVVTLQGKYSLYQSATDALRRCDGEVAECGVYKGGTAKILSELATGRTVHLFDTFSGMPETDKKRDLHRKGDFGDASIEQVQAYLAGASNVVFHKGLIPETLADVSDVRFAFVHIDLDIYEAIKSASEFFYTRMQSGSAIMYDDYGLPSCPGARQAVDEFYEDKPESLLVLSTGQCLVRKL